MTCNYYTYLPEGQLCQMTDGTFCRVDKDPEATGDIKVPGGDGWWNVPLEVNDETIRIILSTKRELLVSPNHQFDVHNRGLLAASFLSLGDEVKVGTEIQCWKVEYVPLPPPVRIALQGKSVTMPKYCTEDIGWLYGYLIGDGTWKKNGYSISAYFNPEENDLCTRFEDLVSQLFEVQPRRYSRKPKDGNIGDRAIKRTQEITILEYNSKILANVFKMPVQKERKIPAIILASKKSVIAAFLTGLYEADGCAFIDDKKDRSPQGKIQLKSCSHRLLQDVQDLLILFGIQARINADNLVIARQSDCRTFIEQIGFCSEKKRACQEKIRSICDLTRSEKGMLEYESVFAMEHLGVTTMYAAECTSLNACCIENAVVYEQPRIFRQIVPSCLTVIIGRDSAQS